MERALGTVLTHSSPDIPLTVHAWVLSSFLLSNLQASGTTLVCTQCYGFSGTNFSWWPEDNTDIGKPVSMPTRAAKTGIWSREFEKALVFANPNSILPEAVKVQLPVVPGRTYREALGQTALLDAEEGTLSFATNQSAVLIW